MAVVYILYSPSLDRYYTGSALNFESRIEQHLSREFSGAFTTKASDWQLYLLIDNLSFRQARNIERRIKLAKSRTYIENLKKYPELIEKLVLSCASD
jgi:putative endonuclease